MIRAMEWRDGLRTFRKSIGDHLAKKGFRYRNGSWRREGAFWRHSFSIEVQPTKAGTRKVYAFPSLWWEQLQNRIPNELARNYPPSDFDYLIHYIRHYSEDVIQVSVLSPEDLSSLSVSWVKALDEDWLPWMEDHDTADRQGAYQSIEYRHIGLRGKEI